MKTVASISALAVVCLSRVNGLVTSRQVTHNFGTLHQSNPASPTTFLNAFQPKEHAFVSYSSKNLYLNVSRKIDSNPTDTFQSLYAAFFIFLTLATASVSLPASATAFDPSVFNGDYADPFHPLCERHLDVSADGKTFHYSGTAVGPKNDPVLRGCTIEEQKEFGLRKGAFDGFIIMNGRGISAGDGIHEGVWEDASVKVAEGMTGGGLDGIRWNDGNKWTRISK